MCELMNNISYGMQLLINDGLDKGWATDVEQLILQTHILWRNSIAAI